MKIILSLGTAPPRTDPAEFLTYNWGWTEAGAQWRTAPSQHCCLCCGQEIRSEEELLPRLSGLPAELRGIRLYYLKFNIVFTHIWICTFMSRPQRWWWTSGAQLNSAETSGQSMVTVYKCSNTWECSWTIHWTRQPIWMPCALKCTEIWRKSRLT